MELVCGACQSLNGCSCFVFVLCDVTYLLCKRSSLLSAPAKFQTSNRKKMTWFAHTRTHTRARTDAMHGAADGEQRRSCDKTGSRTIATMKSKKYKTDQRNSFVKPATTETAFHALQGQNIQATVRGRRRDTSYKTAPTTETAFHALRQIMPSKRA